MRATNYSSKKVIGLAIAQIVVGLFSIALGIASATPYYAGNYPYGHLGYGIFCGVISIVNALLGIVAARSRNPDLIVWHLILSVVVIILGVLQFALGTAAANQDYTIIKLRNLEYDSIYDTNTYTYFKDYKEFLRLYFPMTLLLSSKDNALTQYVYPGTVAVDSLLAIGGILMAILAAIQAACGCRVTCCQETFNDVQQVMVVQGNNPSKTYTTTTVKNDHYQPDE